MPIPDWPPAAELPPLTAATGAVLPPSEVATLIELLRHDIPASVDSTLEVRHPAQPWRRAALSPTLRAALDGWGAKCGVTALDAWMAALLRSWLGTIGTGTARKVRWIVPAAALLGGDGCAALLGTHLRGENYDLRCKGDIAVAALVEIGTRGALLELAQLGKKFPTKYRGEYALQALQTIASAQGLTPDQLQDRILPDGGLDPQGQRTFDYGPRQFTVALDESLAPVLRAPDGRRLTSLPKPTAKDDGVRAADARHAWKIAKTQLQQTARWVARRFEAAMISGETWTPHDFAAFFRSHPLARHVVSRLLWTSVDAARQATASFRIAEDDTLASAADEPCTLSSTTVGIRPVHPLELDPAALATWQPLFAEYQIVGPFPQLDRPVFRISPAQGALQVLTELPRSRVEAKALIFPLETRGWERDGYADGGMVTQHTRRFPSAEIVACLEYEPGAFLGDLLDSEVQTLQRLYFVPANERLDPVQALMLGKIPPIVFSETLRDLHALVPAP